MRARETSGRGSIDWDVGNGAEDARATSVMNVKMVSMLCWADARDRFRATVLDVRWKDEFAMRVV